MAERPAAALTSGQLALRAARDAQTRAVEVGVLRVLGEIAAHEKAVEAETAEGHYGAALRLADELGLRPLAAHCHLGLSKLYRRTGKREQAHEHLTTAATMYREMDMRFWLEQAVTGAAA